MNKHNHLEKNTCQRVHARHTPVHVTRDTDRSLRAAQFVKKKKKKVNSPNTLESRKTMIQSYNRLL